MRAFLAALSEKNADALAATVSLQAPNELVIRTHRKTIVGILKRSLKPTELAQLAKEFDGFELAGLAPGGTPDRLALQLAKGPMRRKIFVREDSDGWKVLDYAGTVNAEPKAKGKARGR